jgi:hypothetical protein
MRYKFELLLKDLWKALNRPNPDRSDLPLAAWGLTRFCGELARDVAKTRQVLDFVRALRSSDALGRQVAEDRLLVDLMVLAEYCGAALEEPGFSRLPGIQAATGAPARTQPVLEVLRELHDFALDCFQFRRPHDAFGGRRRALAFDILARISRVVDLPTVVQLAQQALRKANSVEARQAAEFLEEYFSERDLQPDDTLENDLLSLAEQTDSRSTAYRALNVLVETGAIDEFEALDRFEEWKNKHR